MSGSLKCFKAYDIRGRVPDELNPDLAYRIGRAYAQFIRPFTVVVGRDVRVSSAELARSLSEGLNDGGADVIDIGLCGTEEVYFQTFHRAVDGGIMVTASHNPADYNGMKMVQEGSRPISGDTGLLKIKRLVELGILLNMSKNKGALSQQTSKTSYIEHLLGYIDISLLKPLKIVVNAGNGGAGPVIDLLAERLPFEFICVNHEPDGAFPNGIPNPLLPENRAVTAKAVIENHVDFGIAWDGDFDRCFFFDEQGHFIEGYYLVGLLAQVMLEKYPGEKIIHDPRLTWNTIDIVERLGGAPIQSKTGHAFIKERMRTENAVYGGEMSAHHYFRDFSYCDSGMIPWLLVAESLCKTGQKLSAMVEERKQAFPCSGEINFDVQNPTLVMEGILNNYLLQKPIIDHTDGISVEFPEWRFNLRASNTEPLLRLNVESRKNEMCMRKHVEELSMLIQNRQ